MELETPNKISEKEVRLKIVSHSLF